MVLKSRRGFLCFGDAVAAEFGAQDMGRRCGRTHDSGLLENLLARRKWVGDTHEPAGNGNSGDCGDDGES